MYRSLLTPLSWLYKLGVKFRHNLFDWGVLKSEKFSIPIICIGNITVGGTGKTPMAEMIISYMSRTHKVALLSRGYGRKTKGYLEVQTNSHYRNVGDEPLQIKLKFPETLVVVCEKRADAIRNIQKNHPEIDLIIMDDGFQHRYVDPKINIVMIDATRPTYSDKMLPVGNLRDLPEMLYRANYFVVTKCPEKMTPIERRIFRKELIQVAYQKIYFSRFESFKPQPLYPTDIDPQTDDIVDVIAMSGVGNPKPFVNNLKSCYNVIEEINWEDHHVYRVKEMSNLEKKLKKNPNAVVITTEKDAVKLTNSSKIPLEVRSKLYYVPINITFIEDSATDLLQKLEQDVRAI